MTDLTKLADALEEQMARFIRGNFVYEEDHERIREVVRILRSAAGVDVAGLMAMVDKLADVSYGSGLAYLAEGLRARNSELSARAALESALRLVLAQRVPPGFVVVPREPTEAMIGAFWGEIKHGEPEREAAKQAWIEAVEIAAAPQAKEQGK